MLAIQSRPMMNFACSSTLSHQEMDHTSLLFFACPYFQCWTNTLYTMLTSRAIKKQLCGPVHFHYACLLSYRWQYWYVTTVLPALTRNVFYGGCSVFIWLPLILENTVIMGKQAYSWTNVIWAIPQFIFHNSLVMWCWVLVILYTLYFQNTMHTVSYC